MNLAVNQKPDFLICPSNDQLSDRFASELYFGVVQVRNPSPPNTQTFFLFPVNSTAFGRTSYLPMIGGFINDRVSAGRGIDISQRDAAGPFRNRGQSIPVSKLGDGSSNTLMWGESLGSIDPPGEGTPVNNTGAPRFNGTHLALVHGGILTGDRWALDLPQGIIFGSARASIHWLVGSVHPGGSNVSKCDGSVEFLTNSTTRAVMTQLGCGNYGWIEGR